MSLVKNSPAAARQPSAVNKNGCAAAPRHSSSSQDPREEIYWFSELRMFLSSFQLMNSKSNYTLLYYACNRKKQRIFALCILDFLKMEAVGLGMLFFMVFLLSVDIPDR